MINVTTTYQAHGPKIPPFWLPLIRPIEEYLDDYNESVGARGSIHIQTVEEKDGRLNIVTNGTTDRLQELIDGAVAKAQRICMVCGNETSSADKHLCDSCIKEYVGVGGK